MTWIVQLHKKWEHKFYLTDKIISEHIEPEKNSSTLKTFIAHKHEPKKQKGNVTIDFRLWIHIFD